MQILTTANPAWKKELQEGGQYARQQQNRRIKFLTLALCIAQGMGFIQMINSGVTGGLQPMERGSIVLFWTAGSMFMLWLGEQITERGIGNGVSLMIFAGIIISLPNQVQSVVRLVEGGVVQWYQVVLLIAIFVAITWLVVMFSSAQRRIPIQHMRRMIGTKAIGGQASYLPLSLNLAGVIPIIFAVALIYMPQQFGSYFPPGHPVGQFLIQMNEYIAPSLSFPKGIIGILVYTLLILFFTYFYTAIQYNVDDIADNLKRHGSFIPGVRPGKQTRDFLDGVISRLTIVGALFLALVALMQSIAPEITRIQGTGQFFGTSLLILVSVVLETVRQIEANLLMKQYGQ
jgi:preprotein translocase subunit SecY